MVASSFTELPTTSGSKPVISAAGFVQSIGVNVDMDFFDTIYGNSAEVVASLQYLGIDRVRDSIPATDAISFAPYTLLATDGIKFDLFVPDGSVSLSTEMANLDYFAQQLPGAITSVEGPNEVNIYPVTYNGVSGFAGAVALQKALYAAVHADPNLASVPVYALTLGGASTQQEKALGNLSAYADYGNAHVYPDSGDPPNPNWLSPYLSSQSIPTGSQPMVMTEWGYATLNNPAEFGVSEEIQADYDLDVLFDAQALGVHQTFLYELLDGDSSSSDTDDQQHFGLFHTDGTPKVAATAIHNLTAILADTGTMLPAAALDYQITNLTNAGGNSLLMEKSSGAFDLAVWAEPVAFDTATFSDVAVPDDSVTITLGGTYATVAVYDPLLGATAIETLHDISTLQIDITDHPLIVEVEPGLASSGGGQSTVLQIITGGVFAMSTIDTALTIDTTAAVTAFGGTSMDETVAAAPAGSLTFVAGTGSGTLQGGNGTTTFISTIANAGNWRVALGGGENTVLAATGQDTVTTGAGRALIWLGQGAASVTSSGADTVVGQGGAATVSAGTTSDLVFGGAGGLSFVGGTAASTVVGFGGALTVFGGSGGGLFYGGPGGGNMITAGTGNATMWGSAGGGDVLTGGAGLAAFVAGPGADTIVAGSGIGAMFFVNGRGGGTVTVENFIPGRDFISLQGFSAGATAAALAASATANGSTAISLPDGTTVSFIGVTQLSSVAFA